MDFEWLETFHWLGRNSSLFVGSNLACNRAVWAAQVRPVYQAKARDKRRSLRWLSQSAKDSLLHPSVAHIWILRKRRRRRAKNALAKDADDEHLVNVLIRRLRLLEEHVRREILLMRNAHRRALADLHDLNWVCVSDDGKNRQKVFHHSHAQELSIRRRRNGWSSRVCRCGCGRHEIEKNAIYLCASSAFESHATRQVQRAILWARRLLSAIANDWQTHDQVDIHRSTENRLLLGKRLPIHDTTPLSFYLLSAALLARTYSHQEKKVNNGNDFLSDEICLVDNSLGRNVRGTDDRSGKKKRKKNCKKQTTTGRVALSASVSCRVQTVTYLSRPAIELWYSIFRRMNVAKSHAAVCVLSVKLFTEVRLRSLW